MARFDRRLFLQTASAALAGTYAVRLFAGEVVAAPEFAKESTFDPMALFLTWQRDPTTTMTVQWIGAEDEGTNRPIYYAKAGTQEWRRQPFQARPFPMTEKKVFRAELTGLEPGADYRFRVGLDSAEQKFRTMPAKATNTIQFVSGGDAGIGIHTVQTNKLAASQSPMFVVIGGDIAYENGRLPSVFLEFLKTYSRDLRDEQRRLIPMVACLGNHEVNGGYGKTRNEAPFFYSVFDGLFPETGYATLDFGDYLSLVLLDTGHTSPIEGAQTDWLDKTLKDRQQIPNLFVYNHVPAYPSVREFGGQDSEHGTGSGNRKHWVPLFEKYNVDAVFEHHDHAYKRTHPLLGGHINANGIVYLGDGSWGKVRMPAKMETRPYMAVAHEAYHMSLHRIEGDQRFHVALSDTGKIVDVCTTTKRAAVRKA